MADLLLVHPAAASELHKRVHIDALPQRVWRALIDPAAIAAWTSDEPLEVITDWRIGGPIVFRGVLHGRLRFENHGVVEAFEPALRLQYTHYSSLSKRALGDVPENHVVIEFALTPDGGGTRLDLTLRRLHDEAVRGHMDFHWDMTLPALKCHCEREDVVAETIT
ncbi:SRPBCC domain-containing protein [Lysobacter sp.]|uniref:SRPBCC family protein n=1 Tax=Lysobacter sp. TaxID=72226 RepID=UPI002D5F9AC7|nr:SRPBCC domain-containing protein [Lysobacter sp.]HZX78845.1 SRPBCC domain-containing protein [Lysobacter sp.]